jgi:zinc protease
MAPSYAEESAPSIPFETYTLQNGLNVILSEDKSIPFVQVNIWYNVGSKDETPGLSGFAHLFEHLMFQGSEHYDQEYFAALEEIGAKVNGTTSFDRTNYFEGVPAEHLPLALWIESDRMGWLLPALTKEKLTNQQEVVRNERRQRYEVTPFGEVWVWLFEHLYPEGHPYHIPTIGTHEDIENANLDDVKAFFEKWYVPSNASLVVCGDFDTQQTKELIEKYFGEVPSGNPVTPLRSIPFQGLDESKEITKEDKVPFSKVWVAWPTPALYKSGDAELDILSTLLTDGKDSILYQSLIETGLAKDVQAFQYSTILQGQYIIEITPASGHSTDEVVAKIDESLSVFTADESKVQMAKNSWETLFYEGLESISRKADMLNGYYTNTGDPGYIGQDIARYRGVSAQSIQKTFSQYILNQNRVVLHVHPAKQEQEQ